MAKCKVWETELEMWDFPKRKNLGMGKKIWDGYLARLFKIVDCQPQL